MATYGEIVSRINNNFNSLTKDVRVPKRYILSVVKETGSFILSQRMRDKSLYRETNLFKWIKCLELKKQDIVRCPIIEFKKCNSIMKSKKKLPKIIGSKYGYAVLVVTTIDGETKFSPVTLPSYINLKNRKNSDKFLGKNYYIDNGYLYLPDSEIETVDILLLSLDEDLDECSECSDSDPCESVWDKELSIPDKLLTLVIQQTMQEISTRFGIPKDENSNLDSNQKTATV